jgi:hypothetical protein
MVFFLFLAHFLKYLQSNMIEKKDKITYFIHVMSWLKNIIFITYNLNDKREEKININININK